MDTFPVPLLMPKALRGMLNATPSSGVALLAPLSCPETCQEIHDSLVIQSICDVGVGYPFVHAAAFHR